MRKLIVSLLTVVGAFGCGADGSGRERAVSVSKSALSSPGIGPMPFKYAPSAAPASEPQWLAPGNRVDLLVADAFAACALAPNGDGTFAKTPFTNLAPHDGSVYFGQVDSYLEHLDRAMASVTCNGLPPTTTLDQWHSLRTHIKCNADPVTLVQAAADLSPLGAPLSDDYLKIPTVITGGGLLYTDFPGTALLNQTAAVNLCIAQSLRAQAPGTSSVGGLLLTSAEQRQLLEVTRERAQISMLSYATMVAGAVSGNPNIQAGAVGNSADGSALWADGLGATFNQVPANDFLTAVQLHISTTQDIAALLRRSGDAHAPRGGAADTTADDVWGAGAWRQRSQALLYGGDPLLPPVVSGGQADAPWQRFVSGRIAWPDRQQAPYVSTEIRDPRVNLLLGMARTCDVVDLKIAHSDFCGSVDREATADRLYRAVESCTRPSVCTPKPIGPGPGGFAPVPTCTVIPSANELDVADYESYSLWTTYGITPEHAVVLANVLAEETEPFCTQSDLLDSQNIARWQSGAKNFSGSVSEVTLSDKAGDPWTHFEGHGSLVDRPLAQTVGMYARSPSGVEGQQADAPQVLIPLPKDYNPAGPADGQGYPDAAGTSPATADHFERMRQAGAVDALVATRDVLISALDTARASAPGPAALLSTADAIIGLANAATGTNGVSVRPRLYAPDGGIAQYGQGWNVDVTFQDGDAFWGGNADGAPQVTVYAVPRDPWAANLALFPGKSVMGRTIGDVTEDPATVTAFSAGPPGPVHDGVRQARYVAYLTDPSGQGGPWTLIAVKSKPLVGGGGGGLAPVPVLSSHQYRLLASNLVLEPDQAKNERGTYLSFGGKLDGQLARELQTRPENPTAPSLDAYELPTNLFPPTDPALFGGVPGETSASHYLANASASADDATAAVKLAFENLIAQQSDVALTQAALAKSQLIDQQEVKALCGDNNPQCNAKLQLVDMTLNPVGSACEAHADPQTATAEDFIADLRCRVSTPLSSTIRVPVVVFDAKQGASFPEFAGGSLQGALIDQTASIVKLNAAGRAFDDATEAALATATQMDVAIQTAQDNADNACSSSSMWEGVVSGLSVGISLGENTAVGIGWSPAGWINAKKQCEAAQAIMAPALASAAAANASAFAALSAQIGELVDAQARVLEDLAQLARLVSAEKLATQSSDADAYLSSTSATTSFQLYRVYHSYDLLRAQALVENARKQAVVARRAIEAQYLVNLSSMKSDEPFVAAPATWADEIYDYDLSLPSAVGLQVTSGAVSDGGGVYPNKLKDYANNLTQFVQGYAISHPSAVAHADSDVLSIPGPMQNAEGLTKGKSKNYAWSFLCANGKWVPLGTNTKIAKVCGTVAPTRAKVAFSLDPWARLEGGSGDALAKRYNERWGRLAVNLVGTSVLDCTKAADPKSCYSQSFVPYNLTAVGPSWVAAFDGEFRELATPTGQIEQGKALTAEEWLDPVTNGWEKPFVASVARTEFSSLPFQGTYVLDIQLHPEVLPEHIERVQVLVESNYWVKQQLGAAMRTTWMLGAALLLATACSGSDDNAAPAQGAAGAAGSGGAAGAGPSGHAGASGGPAGSGGVHSGGSSGHAGTTSAGSGGAAGQPGGAAGAGGTGGTSGAAGTSAGSAGAAGSGGQPMSKICGDGIRDDKLEECDLGMAAADVLCDASCHVVDHLAVPSDALLGLSLHPAALSPAGLISVVASDDGSGALHVVAVTPDGVAVAASPSLDVPTAAYTPGNAAVTSLDGAAFVAAFTDKDQDGDVDGIALRQVALPAGTVGPIVRANQTTSGAQRDPDVVWTGSQLIVAWTDESVVGNFGDITVRAFDAQLKPLGGEMSLAATSADETAVSLAAFGTGWAAAYRVLDDAGEHIAVQAGATTWTLGPYPYAAASSRPAVVAIDATHLLVAFTSGADSSDPTSMERVQIAVLDAASPGSVDYVELDGASPGIQQGDPALAVVGGEVFAAWRTDADPTSGDDVWLRKLSIQADKIDLSEPALPLPRRPEHRAGDQRRPSLSQGVWAGKPVLLASWEDSGGALVAAPPQHAVALELIAVPLLRLSN